MSEAKTATEIDVFAAVEKLGATALAIKAERDGLRETIEDFISDHDNGLGPDIERLRNAIKEVA